MSGINAISGASQQQTFTAKRSLGHDDFLKLLVAQLQQQDPLEPVQNTEFVAQMSQLTSLEQLQDINKSFEQLIEMQLFGSYREELIFSSSLLGRMVEAKNPQTDELIKGKVQGFYQQDGVIWLQLEQQAIPAEWVARVAVAGDGGESR